MIFNRSAPRQFVGNTAVWSATTVAVLVIATLAYSADYYVADRPGSGAGTKDDPFGLADLPKPDNRPTRALAMLQPGDTLWLKGGEVSLPFYGAALALQSDGQIIVAGSVYNTSSDFAVARFNSDGTTLGVASVDMGGEENATAVAIQSNGQIVVTGNATGTNSDTDLAVARFNGDLSIDTTFGDSDEGWTITNIGLIDGNNADDGARGICVDGSQIVVVGSATIGDYTGWTTDFAIAYYGSDGTLSSTQTIDFGGYDSASSVAVLPGGGIVVAGTSSGDGSEDPSYFAVYRGGSTVMTLVSGNQISAASSVAVQASGDRIVVAGWTNTANSNDFAIVRYCAADLSLDEGFGDNGVTTTDFGGSSDCAYAVVFDICGRVIAGGLAGEGSNFAMARYSVTGLEDRWFAQQDASGNITSIVDRNGQVAERYLYDPYGSATVLASTWEGKIGTDFSWNYLFQGGRFDATSGLYHFGARDLSPTLGRWMQNDAGGYINGANTYQFVLSNPLVYTDPTGLCAESGWNWWLQKGAAVLQIIQGVTEMAIGYATTWTGVGIFVGLHGVDTTVAGVRNLFGNGTAKTFTEQGATDIAKACGASDAVAKRIGKGTDIAASLLSIPAAITKAAQAERAAAEVVTDVLSAGERGAARAAGRAVEDSSGFVMRGGNTIRDINWRPANALDVQGNWGLRGYHLEKHFFGEGKMALKQIDPGGTTEKWVSHLTELGSSTPTGATRNGMIDIINEFPRANGMGTFKLGIRLAPVRDGSFDLVTVLTKQ